MVLGIVFLALNLRTPIIAPTAILPRIQEGTGFSAAGLATLSALQCRHRTIGFALVAGGRPAPQRWHCAGSPGDGGGTAPQARVSSRICT